MLVTPPIWDWDRSAMPFRRWTFRWSPFWREIGHKSWHFWWECFLCTFSKKFRFSFRVKVSVLL